MLMRLSTSMQPTDANWQLDDSQMNEQPGVAAALKYCKEKKLKLSLEMRNNGEVMIVHCQGRIVYRDEAATLSRTVSQILQQSQKLVLDLSGVISMDSAGIGVLALLQVLARASNVSLKIAGASPLVQTLLGLTNLDSVLEVHPSLDAALASFHEEPTHQEACVGC
jgi:anti-sigma B factor antagonist